MKKKSGHRRRTKVVRRSRKNLRRTVKRNNIRKSRRRPTRRYSRVQRGGLGGEASVGTSLPECVTIKEFYDSAINEVYKDNRESVALYLSPEKKNEFDEWMKSEKIVKHSSMSGYTMTMQYPYPVDIVNNILKQIVSTDKKLCKNDLDIIIKKIQGFPFIEPKLLELIDRNG